MTPEAALAALEGGADAERAAGMAAYHKAPRRYLGVTNGEIDLRVAEWRAALDVQGRVALAEGLWLSDVHEAKIAAAKLLIQARIPEDEAVWRLIASWAPGFDAWAVADTAASAGERRLAAHPARLDDVEAWTASPNMWTRRAALTFTLHLAKGRFAPEADRERALGWAAAYVADRDWFIQKAVAWWLRTLSKRDPERVRAFLAAHGAEMKAFARKEAGKYL